MKHGAWSELVLRQDLPSEVQQVEDDDLSLLSNGLPVNKMILKYQSGRNTN